MNIDIFESAKEKVAPSWAKFKEAGDSVQGTYVGKIVGQIDGYGNEQIIYQLLQNEGNVVNVAFGLNKKVMNQDMESVKFGQIVGFRYKGKILVKDKFGKPVEVKEFSLHQDPSIVNKTWLKENEGNMPTIIRAEKESPVVAPSEPEVDNVPFTSEGSLTNEDKARLIGELATAKLGVIDGLDLKERVKESTGLAMVAANYDTIVEKLTVI